MFGYTEDQAKYAAFVQKFIEVQDNLSGLASEVNEYLEHGEQVPEDVSKEHKALYTTWEFLIKEGAEKYGKNQVQLYKDGWDYWIYEDKILREKRYGK